MASCEISSPRSELQSTQPDRRARAITRSRCSTTWKTRARSSLTWPTSLAENGVWVMELHYLPTMLELNAFDVIVHEHLEYYSLAVIERLVAQAGLHAGRAS